MLHRKGRLATIAAVGALSVMLAACSGGDSSGGSEGSGQLDDKRAGAMSDYAAGQQFKATEPLTFTSLFLDQSHYPMKKDWALWSELTKRTNVTLDLTVVPNSDYDQKRGLLLGSGDAPLLIPKTYPGQETQFVAGGAVLPVSDYVDLMPNFQDKVRTWGLDDQLDTLRQLDGKYYVLPGLHEDVWPDYTLGIRTDVLKEVGKEMPKTVEDLHDVLVAMKQKHPDVYPWTDRFNQTDPAGALFQIMSQSFGTAAGWAYTPNQWDPEQKKFIFPATTDAYKNMVTYLNGLVKEGLIDPESFTQTDDQWKQKIANGKGFVFSTNAQTLVNDVRTPLASTNPSATVSKMPNPIGPAGPNKGWSRLENGLMISAKAKDSPNFVALMQFVDWLWYSDQGEEFAKWGVEGLTYTKDASGKRTLADDVNFIGLNPDGTKDLQKDFGFMCGNYAYGGSTDLLQSMFSDEEVQYQEAMEPREPVATPPPAPFDDEEQEQAGLVATPLRDYVSQQTLRFVLGQRPLTEWGAFVSEANSKGAEKYVGLVNDAYERYQKDHS